MLRRLGASGGGVVAVVLGVVATVALGGAVGAGCGRAGYDERDGGRDGAAGVDGGVHVDGGVDGRDGGPRSDGGGGGADGGPASDGGAVDGGAPMDGGGGRDGGVGVDGGAPCTVSCVLDTTMPGPPPACTGGAPLTASPIMMGQGTAIVDMSGFTALVVTLHLCDPLGFVFHLGDSPTNDGFGGDGGSSSNDAELQVNDGTLTVYGSDLLGGVRLTEPSAVPVTGCSSYTVIVGDQTVATATMRAMGPELLRIDPPTDAEGTPDALWYVGLNRTYSNASRAGTGLRSATLCFR